jgi:uncharacterized membrane protein
VSRSSFAVLTVFLLVLVGTWAWSAILDQRERRAVEAVRRERRRQWQRMMAQRQIRALVGSGIESTRLTSSTDAERAEELIERTRTPRRSVG